MDKALCLVLKLSSSSRKPAARAGLTCGRTWKFYVYKAATSDEPARYAVSRLFNLGEDLSNLDLVLGLLIDWVCFKRPDYRAYLISVSDRKSRVL
jgi:hypothetical protein